MYSSIHFYWYIGSLSYKQISYSETGKLKAVLKLEKIGKADQESQILSVSCPN